MDWKGIVATVLAAIVLSWLGYVTSSVGEAKHERDIMGEHVATALENNEENKEAIKGVWKYNDEKAKVEMETLLELHNANHKNEIAILELKIEILESRIQ